MRVNLDSVTDGDNVCESDTDCSREELSDGVFEIDGSGVALVDCVSEALTETEIVLLRVAESDFE